ncbi:hypothetical protein HELRODRAFT_157156 [Helobdella robusta]|uniref:Serpin domain-containing protein n=1 Tax=Helobdella robusta TaxID=6412 RepID=T1EM72_HELRO|nr:hypothetical protein HELRODRAFT_157156 [Helobdella robusta]ESO03162.1 hypothetical protein HELRODRAFT_157156 [Helobdella robusta]
MDLQALGSSNAEFGVDLYQKLATANPDENVFFSPISLLFALAITLLGAKEKTEAQLKSVLKLDQFAHGEVHSRFADLMRHLQQSDGNYELNIANKLYGEETENFLSDFLEESKKYYGSGLEPVSFLNNADGIRSMINSWVEKQTHQKIRDLLPAGLLDALTRLVIVNAVYFKGTWKTQFDQSETQKGVFVTPLRTFSDVSFMHLPKLNAKYMYNNELNCQILELPYKGDSMSFVVVLPNLKETTLEAVESSMDKNFFSTVDENIWRMDVEIWLPKFKIEKKSNAMESLMKMGIVDLFSESRTDLSKMTGERNLFVSKLLHKAFIEVNEKGSEAAASTGVVISFRSAKIKIKFKADHPFIFYIKDNAIGSILFMGRLFKM